MVSPKELGLELRQTARGRLSYDRSCFKEQSSLEEILEEVDAQNRSKKASLIAELGSEAFSLSMEDSLLFPRDPIKETKPEAKIEISTPKSTINKIPSSTLFKGGEASSSSPPKRCLKESTRLSSPKRPLRLNRSFDIPSEFSVVREAKRRSLERRVLFDNFIRDEVREAEMLFEKKCRILSEESQRLLSPPRMEMEVDKIREKIRVSDKKKEEECNMRLLRLEEKIEAQVVSVPVVAVPQKVPQAEVVAPQKPAPLPEKPLAVPPPVIEATIPPTPKPSPTPFAIEKKISQTTPTTPQVPPTTIPQQQSSNASQRNMERLRDAQEFHQNCKTKLKAFTDKSLKFDIQKVVSTIINAICQVSKAHLKEKLEKLTKLSSGETVLFGESKAVNPSSHSLGVDYAKFIMADKFISHWDEQPKSIFALSAIMAALSSQFPEFGKLLLAVFYRTCPYILPSHNVQGQGESYKDFRMRCGYSYEDDQEEDKEMFIKHITGVVRLYTAYSIAELPQSHADRSIHHGLGNLWRLISSTLNLQPVNEVTAIVLCEVFDIAGHVLLSTYKEHFTTLLELVQRQYIPRIKEITLEGCHGSVSRLEDFFNKFKATQGIPKPEGFLESGFL